jgi:hypothetical protein
VAFGEKAREYFRASLVHPSFLGAIPKPTHLPDLCLLMAMLPGGQILKLSTGLGI